MPARGGAHTAPGPCAQGLPSSWHPSRRSVAHAAGAGAPHWAGGCLPAAQACPKKMKWELRPVGRACGRTVSLQSHSPQPPPCTHSATAFPASKTMCATRAITSSGSKLACPANSVPYSAILLQTEDAVMGAGAILFRLLNQAEPRCCGSLVWSQLKSHASITLTSSLLLRTPEHHELLKWHLAATLWWECRHLSCLLRLHSHQQ